MRRRPRPMTATRTRPTLTPPLLVLLALLSAFTPLSIDMYLPALPTIVGELDSTAGDIQLTLSTFMLAFGFGQIFYGPAGGPFGPPPGIQSGIAVFIPPTTRCRFAARGGAARLSPAAASRLGGGPLRRAAEAPPFHGLRAHQHVPVRGADVLAFRLSLRLHPGLRHQPARVRPDLRRRHRAVHRLQPD